MNPTPARSTVADLDTSIPPRRGGCGRRGAFAHVLPLACALLLGLTSTGTALAQDVLLSEIRAEGGESWLELHNPGTNPVDLTGWSIHHATTTTSMPQGYWWPLPSGTVLQPGGYLRVHWFVQGTNGVAPGEYFTGTSNFGFLFGLGGEPLHAAAGAFGLFRTQQNALMNTPSMVVDWVSWGTSGHTREALAAQAGVWTAGRALPAVPAGRSHARHAAAVANVLHPDQAWFVDPTPTPLAPNTAGAVADAYGVACTLPGHHLLGAPALRAPSLPLLGNGEFRFELDHTTGIFGEFVLLGFATGAAPAGLPSPLAKFAGVGCDVAIDPSQLVCTWLAPAQFASTTMPLSLASQPAAIVGLELHVQAMVVELLPFVSPPYQGVSNALRIVVGS